MSSSDSSSTTSHWLKASTDALEKAGIGTARLDCLVLLEDVTGKDRSWLLAHQEFELSSDQRIALKERLTRRLNHEPLAYIRGKSEFYGREFIVNGSVLVPRPESEAMIDMLKELLPIKGTKIIDVGTGSGALGITAAKEQPEATVELLDIDVEALSVAKANCVKHGLEITAYQSDLLDAVDTADILLANLPYVPDEYLLNKAALGEPALAIFGGEDGLDLYRRLFAQAAGKKVRYILTESLPFQHDEVQKIAGTCGYEQVTRNGLIQLFRK